MIYIINFLLLVVCFYLGVLLGVKDCKRQFDIPKGVHDKEGYMDYLFPSPNEEEEDFFGFGDLDGYNAN